MLNAERFKDEILAKVDKTERFAIETNNQNVLRNCIDLECSECLFNEGTGLCYFERMKWLLSKYKKHIKLTRFEYEILGHLFKNKQYKFIGRDFAGVWVYKDEPTKSADNEWQNMSVAVPITVFDNIFKFVTDTDEEAFKISDILNNCDVVDN